MRELIERQAAIDAINSWRGRFSEEYNEAIDDCENSIKELPTVQPEPRTGKWTLGFDNKYMEKYYYCSCCGGRKYGEHKPFDYFCSNCGADMRGEQDE